MSAALQPLGSAQDLAGMPTNLCVWAENWCPAWGCQWLDHPFHVTGGSAYLRPNGAFLSLSLTGKGFQYVHLSAAEGCP